MDENTLRNNNSKQHIRCKLAPLEQ